jgi:FkbM family methyltransferase
LRAIEAFGESMLVKASRLLKKYSPRLHSSLKLALLRAQLPVPKLLRGRLVLVAPQLFSSRPTESHVLKWIDERLRPGDTFYDVGAHYGWMSLLACRKVGAHGKVIAFEPSPPLLEFLNFNKRANGFSQLQIMSRAVAASAEPEVPFYLKDEGDSFLNSLVPRSDQNPAHTWPNKSSIPVETTTLDSFCQETQFIPDAIKIDVEGAELLVLQGARALLKQRRPILMIAIHPTWLPQDQTADELFELLHSCGYQIADSKVVTFEGADFGDYLCVAK